VAEDDT
jgi:hypothetical protein